MKSGKTKQQKRMRRKRTGNLNSKILLGKKERNAFE